MPSCRLKVGAATAKLAALCGKEALGTSLVPSIVGSMVRIHLNCLGSRFNQPGKRGEKESEHITGSAWPRSQPCFRQRSSFSLLADVLFNLEPQAMNPDQKHFCHSNCRCGCTSSWFYLSLVFRTQAPMASDIITTVTILTPCWVSDVKKTFFCFPPG